MLTLLIQEMIDDLESIKLTAERFESGSFSHGLENRKVVRKTRDKCEQFIRSSKKMEKVFKDEYRESRKGLEDRRKNNLGNELFKRRFVKRK